MSRLDHDWPDKPVYYPYNKDGVTFALMASGEVFAAMKGIAPIKITRLAGAATGLPWIPRERNFNSLCRQFIRDGDVDHLIAERKSELNRQENIRKAAPELLEALEGLVAWADDLPCQDPAEDLQKARAAIARATGGAE